METDREIPLKSIINQKYTKREREIPSKSTIKIENRV